MPVLKILIADDHEIVRQGMRSMLEAQRDCQVVGEAADGGEIEEEEGGQDRLDNGVDDRAAAIERLEAQAQRLAPKLGGACRGNRDAIGHAPERADVLASKVSLAHRIAQNSRLRRQTQASH